MTHTNPDKLRPALRDARLIHAPAPDNYRAPICGRAIPSDHAVATSVAEWNIIADYPGLRGAETMNARPVRTYRTRDGQVLVGYDTGDRDDIDTADKSVRLENVRRYSSDTGECLAYYPTLEGIYVSGEMGHADGTYWADQWIRDEYDERHAAVRAAEDAYDVARRAFNEIAYVVGED